MMLTTVSLYRNEKQKNLIRPLSKWKENPENNRVALCRKEGNFPLVKSKWDFLTTAFHSVRLQACLYNRNNNHIIKTFIKNVYQILICLIILSMTDFVTQPSPELFHITETAVRCSTLSQFYQNGPGDGRVTLTESADDGYSIT